MSNTIKQLKDAQGNAFDPQTSIDALTSTGGGGKFLTTNDLGGGSFNVTLTEIQQNGTPVYPSNGVLNLESDIQGANATTLAAGSSATATIDSNKTLQLGIPRGADGANGQDAYNPFKGWYDSSSNLPANPVVGDYAYVKGAESTDPAAIYECTTAGSWSDSGRTADTSNVQTFASGEEVNEVHIINDLTTGGVNDVLSAEQGKLLGEDVQQNTKYIELLNYDVTYNLESYSTKLYGNNNTYKLASSNATDIGIYKLIGGHKYKFDYNYSYGLVYSSTCVAGYVSSSSVEVGDSYTSIINGDSLVEGFSTIIEPEVDSYIFMLWRLDNLEVTHIPCMLITDVTNQVTGIKDVVAESPYKDDVETDITQDYLQLYDDLDCYYDKFRTSTASKCSLYQLIKGKSYRFVTNFTNPSVNIFQNTILSTVSSPSDIEVGGYAHRIIGGDKVVDGFEYTMIPSENMYLVMIWRGLSSAGPFNPCFKIYESNNDNISLKEVIGELEDLNTSDKSSIVGAINSLENIPLRGKTIALDGDSICYGAGYLGGYGKIIAERNGMTYQNLAVGGATIAAETYSSPNVPRHWICRNIENLRSDADYIILEGGVNDLLVGEGENATEQLGTMTNDFISTLDDTTFIGACEKMCRDLLGRFKGKKVGFIIVHQVWGFTNFRTSDTRYKNLVAVLEKWGVPYCDLNIQVPAFGLLNSSDPIRVDYTDNGDGWHPNELGYKKYYCDKIEAWMRGL